LTDDLVRVGIWPIGLDVTRGVEGEAEHQAIGLGET